MDDCYRELYDIGKTYVARLHVLLELMMNSLYPLSVLCATIFIETGI